MVKWLPFDGKNIGNYEKILDTESLMAKFRLSREEANECLWNMYDKGYIDVKPVPGKEDSFKGTLWP